MLLIGVGYAINPVEQIKKAEDAEKRNHLLQMKNALDQYYHDRNNYPKDVSTYKAELISGNYIKEIHKDAVYKVDTVGGAGQWYVAYIKKSAVSSNSATSDCQIACSSFGTNPKSDYVCTFAGDVDVSQC